MPRIHPRHIWQARAINRALLTLLPVCRDLGSARNELRWLKQHALAVSRQTGHYSHSDLLTSFVSRRARGEPLQYVLGSEYFGELEIKCRPGVLIPRPETAASTTHLARLISSTSSPEGNVKRRIRLLDCCTGSGCIPLLIHHEYYSKQVNDNSDLELVGIDISSDALSLARDNLIHQIARQGRQHSSSKARTKSLQSIGFVQADILRGDHGEPDERGDSGPLTLMQALARLNDSAPPIFDILTANPPYISPKSFQSTTARSVRQYEPKQALVPLADSSASASDIDVGDLFYPKLLDIADQIQAKVVLFEVADMEQAVRVASMAVQRRIWDNIEIWRDEPGAPSAEQKLEVGGQNVVVRGLGHGRSVFGYRADAGRLLDI